MNLDGKACMYFIVFVHIKYDQIKILLFFENDLLSSAIIAIFFQNKGLYYWEYSIIYKHPK